MSSPICDHCFKDILRGTKHFIAVVRHETFFYCSDLCRTLGMNPPKEFLELVKQQLGQLYLDVDIKIYRGGSE